MSDRPSGTLRRAMHLANANAVMWAIGNGLVSTTLVIYLALELGATGIAISLLLAAPRFVGVLRIAAPGVVGNSDARRKALCMASYLASGLVLWLLPACGAPGGILSTSGNIAALVVCWCFYHLLEYIATIALWSWLGDWMPPPIRGRLIGWRERYLVIGRIVGIGLSVLLAMLWGWADPAAPRWQPLAWLAAVGAPVMLLALLPLAWLPATGCNNVNNTSRPTWRELLQPFVDPAYRRLLAYSCWFAVANGITGAAQSLYPQRVLGIDYRQMIGLRSLMYSGQAAFAPAIGSWMDKYGSRRLLTAAQLTVATGPLFFLLATPEHPWWVAGAFIVWIAYVAVNVGFDNLKLRLAPTHSTTPSLAVYYAMSDLASGITLVVAGAWYDRLTAGGTDALRLYTVLFLAGWVMRSLAAVLAWQIPDNSPFERQ